eukprot:scaffold2767_cov177-Amphora_coffeaeformis.AAC.57
MRFLRQIPKQSAAFRRPHGPSKFQGRLASKIGTNIAPLCHFRSQDIFRMRTQILSSFSTVAEPARTQEDDNENQLEENIDLSLLNSRVMGHPPAKATNEIDEYLRSRQIKSRPVPNGNWQVLNPLGWAKDFGRRSEARDAEVRKLACLKPGDEGYFDVSDITVPGVTIVRTKEHAEKVLPTLQAADSNLFHACDTEVMAIDLSSVGPVGNGFVTCVSIYSGPDFDYGLGDGPGTCLWIDNLDDAFDILQIFKPWFENEKHLKVWHNYGFDRHVMWNEGIDVRGFGGDTMHMARLQDTSRSKLGKGNGYSLEALTEDLCKIRKKPMKEIFGVKRLKKDGTEGSLVDIPPVEVMQRDPKFRIPWIQYSSYDAKGTWSVREELAKRLEAKSWMGGKNLMEYYMMHMRPFGEVLTDMERRGIRVDARDYLAKVETQAREDRAHHSWVFREWAAKQIGPDGWALNTASSVQLQTFLFGGSRNSKTGETTEDVRVFKVPRDEIPPEALEAYRLHEEETKNRQNKDEAKPEEKDDMLDKMKAVQLKTLCKERGLKVSGKKAELIERLREHFLQSNVEEASAEPNMDDFDAMSDEDLADAVKARSLSPVGSREELLERIRDDIAHTNELLTSYTPQSRDGYVALSEALEEAAKKEGGALAEYLDEFKLKSKKVPKYIDVKISTLGKLEPAVYTQGGAPSVTANVLKELAGDPFADPPRYGSAFKHVGKEGCEALFSLCSIGSIDTMIANFLTSLQELADDQSRVHCSLNLNTETGRLSSRRPNLQNQPALEKDKYKIRKAFEASPGNNLIVADYGQLELRILASMTKCHSMVKAFEAGGDFHSRTAVDMFDYVKAAVDSGEVLLEWDYSQGQCPKPLVKDQFASERRKAKTLNFSIAYGKTAHGLSQDWGVSPTEAGEMLQKWYDARPEVRDWQQGVKQTARAHGYTRTLMGRYRNLPDAMKKDRKLSGQAERASINTPIQGGAADIAMMAMNKINQSQKLKDLGWILLLQIHDEVILEGPEETAEEAFEEVLQCMEQPWCEGLNPTMVPLLVDGSCTHKTWYDAK